MDQPGGDTRYADFLQLAKAHPGETLVPTLDIDLIWHVHMLSPLDYRDDCKAILGRVLSHDAQMAPGEIATAFEEDDSAMGSREWFFVRVAAA